MSLSRKTQQLSEQLSERVKNTKWTFTVTQRPSGSTFEVVEVVEVFRTISGGLRTSTSFTRLPVTYFPQTQIYTQPRQIRIRGLRFQIGQILALPMCKKSGFSGHLGVAEELSKCRAFYKQE